MDPHDRLWTGLIFPRCDSAAFLPLRLVCRAFRAQLDSAPSRLWRPLTMLNSHMRYAERWMGWPGVLLAMARERNTRANCDAGHAVPGPVVQKGPLRAMVVAGHVACFTKEGVCMYDVDTGVQVAVFDVQRAIGRAWVVLDRFIAFAGEVDQRAWLLDCVAAQLVELDHSVAGDGRITMFSAAGACLAYHLARGTEATVVRLCIDDSGVPTVQRVARLMWNRTVDGFLLCQRGVSYLIFETTTGVLTLHNVLTGQPVRVFTCCESFAQPGSVERRLTARSSKRNTAVVVHTFRRVRFCWRAH